MVLIIELLKFSFEKVLKKYRKWFLKMRGSRVHIWWNLNATFTSCQSTLWNLRHS